MLCYPSFNRKLFDSLTDRFNLDPKRKISSFSKVEKASFHFCSVFVQEQNISSVTKRSTDLIRSFARLLKVFFAAEILNRDFTPIISSHNLRELEDFCDSIGLLHQGQLLLTQSLDQIKCSVCKLQCVNFRST